VRDGAADEVPTAFYPTQPAVRACKCRSWPSVTRSAAIATAAGA